MVAEGAAKSLPAETHLQPLPFSIVRAQAILHTNCLQVLQCKPQDFLGHSTWQAAQLTVRLVWYLLNLELCDGCSWDGGSVVCELVTSESCVNGSPACSQPGSCIGESASWSHSSRELPPSKLTTISGVGGARATGGVTGATSNLGVSVHESSESTAGLGTVVKGRAAGKTKFPLLW